jgi:hypothetical protein
MKRISGLAVLMAVVVMTGCSTTKPADVNAPTPTPAAPAVASKAEPAAIIGKPRPGGKFAALKLGMDMEEVQAAMGTAPNKTDAHETGKRWIPFYFGTDARRLEALYRGDGCLTFTGGNIWGGAGGELIAINNDPTGKCFEQQ